MKKLILVLLTFILCLSTINVFASESSVEQLQPNGTVIGYLVDESGNKFEVEGKLVNSVLRNNDGVNSATYEFNLYSSNNTLTTNEADGSYSVRAYLTIEYKTQNAPTEYLLTKVSGYWNILDSSVTVTNAKLSYGCTGRFPDQIWTQTKTLNVSNNFSYNTGFSKYVTDDTWSTVGADLTLDLKMGTSRTWSFTIINQIVS